MGGDQERDSHLSSGLKISAVSAAVNVVLSAAKVAAGIYGNSRVLVADGLHSLSDLVTDAVVALGLYYGNQPYDASHPYGHKKIETVAEMITGGLLVAFAGWMVVSALRALGGGTVASPSLLTLVVACVSILAKEWLFRATLKVGRKLESGALVANAWHHRSDALTSLFAMAAIALARLHQSLVVLDPLASIGVSILVGKIGVNIAWTAFHGIIDTAPDADVIGRIREVSLAQGGVSGIHKVRARYLGGQIIADFHIKVDPDLTVHEGHRIASAVEKAVGAELGNIYDVTVHVEPADGNG
ncbi:MAG: cation transporter [Candidatus Glassbacteria bacterium]|nr:cation transporter [Candidatus Glassbacteria bacterium]